MTLQPSVISQQTKNNYTSRVLFPTYSTKDKITNDLRIFLANYKLSIVIPCYNEAESIADVIQLINSLQLYNYEIVIVDDGSTDKSVQIIESLAGPIVLIKHRVNQGYGKTLRDGFLGANGDLVITLDADGQHTPFDIPYLCYLAIQHNADMVIGSRYKGKYAYRIPFLNRAGEAFIEAILWILYGKRIRNNQSGMRIFANNAYNIMKKNFHFKGMAFTVELLMKGFNHDMKIIEGPIRLKARYNGTSKVKKLPLLFNLLKCIYFNGWKRRFH